jgi:hypothetical protein
MVDTPAAAPVLTPVQQAEAAYDAALAAAAAPDPKAKELRDTAMQLLQQANALDGPVRMQARQTRQQFQQFRQRNAGQHQRLRPAQATGSTGATGAAK